MGDKYNKFRDYVLLREGLDEKGGTEEKSPMSNNGAQTTLTLGKNNDYRPFFVTDDPRNPSYPSNKNLAPIIRAFKDSKKVKVYNSMGKGGEPKPHTLGTKSLYMVGGAVRDLLRGKTPKDIDLVTDATPDEIRMILSDSGFSELGKDKSSDGKQVFYVKGKDKSGTDFVFGVKVNGQEFDLATFRKDSHGSDGRFPDQMTFGGQKDDASRRDLTINSLYLLLSNDDGPNNQVTDFHGGIHDMERGEVKFVGNPEERLDEDLLRALRYARFAASVGGGKTSGEIEAAIKKAAPRIRDVISPERIQSEFLKGLEDDDVDPAKFVEIYKKLGLLDVVFPGMRVKLDTADDYPRDKDPAIVVATLLRGNDPDMIKANLKDGRWKNQDIDRIGFLHKILNLNPNLSPDDLDGYLQDYKKTGILGPSIEKWWSANNKGNQPLLRAFLDLAKAPRIRTFVGGEDGSDPTVDPDFADLFDKVTKSPIPGMEQMIGKRKKHKEHKHFTDLYARYQPRAAANRRHSPDV